MEHHQRKVNNIMELSFDTPYIATYIGVAELTTRESQVIQIKNNRPYGVKVVTEDTEIPYASMNSVLRNWQINSPEQ